MKFGSLANIMDTVDNPVSHKRTIVLRKNEHSVCITDELNSIGHHEATLRFHLSPGCGLRAVTENQVQITYDTTKSVVVSTTGRIDCIAAKDDEMTAWTSSGYHSREPSNCISVHFRFSGDAKHETAISVT